MSYYAVYLKQGRLYESKDSPCEHPFDALMLLRNEEYKAQEEEVPFHRLGVRDENDEFYHQETNFSMKKLRGIYPSGEEELA